MIGDEAQRQRGSRRNTAGQSRAWSHSVTIRGHSRPQTSTDQLIVVNRNVLATADLWMPPVRISLVTLHEDFTLKWRDEL